MAEHAPIPTINPENLVSLVPPPPGSPSDLEKCVYYADQVGIKDQFLFDLEHIPNDPERNREFRFLQYGKHAFAQGAVRSLQTFSFVISVLLFPFLFLRGFQPVYIPK